MGRPPSSDLHKSVRAAAKLLLRSVQSLRQQAGAAEGFTVLQSAAGRGGDAHLLNLGRSARAGSVARAESLARRASKGRVLVDRVRSLDHFRGRR